MSRTKSDFLKGAGKMFEISKAIADEVLAQGGSDDDLARVLSDKQLTKDLASRIVRDKAEVLIATVNYDRSIADGIAAGKYDWKDTDITEKRYSRSGSGTQEVTFSLVHFGKNTSTKDALAELDRRGFRPATLQELLAVGVQHPEKQKAFPIIALGSVWRNLLGDRCVPYLDAFGSQRGLHLHWLGSDWDGQCRFLAVRKC